MTGNPMLFLSMVLGNSFFLEQYLPIFNGKQVTNNKDPSHVLIDQVKVKKIVHNVQQSDGSIKNLMISDASDKKEPFFIMRKYF